MGAVPRNAGWSAGEGEHSSTGGLREPSTGPTLMSRQKRARFLSRASPKLSFPSLTDCLGHLFLSLSSVEVASRVCKSFYVWIGSVCFLAVVNRRVAAQAGRELINASFLRLCLTPLHCVYKHQQNSAPELQQKLKPRLHLPAEVIWPA